MHTGTRGVVNIGAIIKVLLVVFEMTRGINLIWFTVLFLIARVLSLYDTKNIPVLC